MKQTMTAKATLLDKGLQVECESRGFKILLDEPKELGGSNEGMNPVEAVLCAFGACQSIVAKSFARMQNFSFEEFWIEMEGDLDPDGFMGKNPDVRNGFSEVRYKLHFKSKESQEKADAFAQFMSDHCPVGDNLEHGVPMIRTEVVIEK